MWVLPPNFQKRNRNINQMRIQRRWRELIFGIDIYTFYINFYIKYFYPHPPPFKITIKSTLQFFISDQDDTCHCEDCANYRFYIENRSLKNRSISKVKKCQNDSFHETSVVTNIYSSFDLQPTLVEVPPHPISEGPSTTSSFKLSLSTGDIFTSTDLYVDPRIGKTRSDPGFSNTDLCSCKLSNHF